jgi:hypothetical protein
VKPAIRTSLLVVPLVGTLLTALGCGGGGGSGGGAQPSAAAPGTTVVGGVAFSAKSDVLTESPFGEAFGVRTYRSLTEGTPSEHRASYVFTGSVVGGIRTISASVTFIDASGAPITDNLWLAIAKGLINSLGEGWSYAKADDGWIYLVGMLGEPIGTPIRIYPSQVAVGTEWSSAGTHHTTHADGSETTVPTMTTHRVISLTATAPRAGESGCVLLHTRRTEEGKPDRNQWRYFKPGVGLVESTDVDPGLDQSAASGSYLVPDVG